MRFRAALADPSSGKRRLVLHVCFLGPKRNVERKLIKLMLTSVQVTDYSEQTGDYTVIASNLPEFMTVPCRIKWVIIEVMSNPIFETKTFLQSVRVLSDRIEMKEPLRTKSLPLSGIANIDTGFGPSYDFIIETTGGEKHKLLVKSKDKQALKDAIFTAKAGSDTTKA